MENLLYRLERLGWLVFGLIFVIPVVLVSGVASACSAMFEEGKGFCAFMRQEFLDLIAGLRR